MGQRASASETEPVDENGGQEASRPLELLRHHRQLRESQRLSDADPARVIPMAQLAQPANQLHMAQFQPALATIRRAAAEDSAESPSADRTAEPARRDDRTGTGNESVWPSLRGLPCMSE